MPISKVPPWNIAVFTYPDGSGYVTLRNALLYGDHVHWVSIESALGIHHYADELSQIAFPANTGVEVQISEERIIETVAKRLVDWVPDYKRFHTEYLISGADQVVTQHLGPHKFVSFLNQVRDSIVSSGADAFEDVVSRLVNEGRSETQSAIEDSRVLAGPYYGQSRNSGYWNTYQAADAIANSLSRLLLPSVSDLPLDVILESRDRLSPVLSPMRAELLRFTETLRDLVGERRDPARLAAEADNLVATKVEPVVREADEQTRRLLDAKWRKLLTGAAKAFGFAGASFVDPKLLAKAVQQTLETTALAFAEPEDTTPQARAMSQFVLQARSFLADRVS